MKRTASTSSSAVNGAAAHPKEQYRVLKKRFKFLVYENECYQEEIRNLQRKLLKLSRDKKYAVVVIDNRMCSFLLDRLLPWEKLSDSSDDSDATIVRQDDKKPKKKTRAPQRRRAPQQPPPTQQTSTAPPPAVAPTTNIAPATTIATPSTVTDEQPDVKHAKFEN